MDEQALRTLILELLWDIAPEMEGTPIDPAGRLREQVDLDSMDWLNFLIGLHRRLQVDIPEADYAGLRSIDDLVRYLFPRLPPARR